MRTTLTCLALLLAAAPAAASEAPETVLANALRGRVAGPPMSCVPARNLRGPTIVDDRTMIFRSGSTTYLNRLPQSCAGLRPDRALVTSVPSTQLCRGDIFTIVDPPLPGSWGGCAYDEFVPYRRP